MRPWVPSPPIQQNLPGKGAHRDTLQHQDQEEKKLQLHRTMILGEAWGKRAGDQPGLCRERCERKIGREGEKEGRKKGKALYTKQMLVLLIFPFLLCLLPTFGYFLIDKWKLYIFMEFSVQFWPARTVEWYNLTSLIVFLSFICFFFFLICVLVCLSLSHESTSHCSAWESSAHRGRCWNPSKLEFLVVLSHPV